MSEQKMCPTADKCDSTATGKAELLQLKRREHYNPRASISLTNICNTVDRELITQIPIGEMHFLKCVSEKAYFK
jgi:hypothetical protein